MTNVERARLWLRHLRFACRVVAEQTRVINSSFNTTPVPTIRHSLLQRAVTIIEMLVVIMVIFILAALVLAASSYVQNKGARARAETEIAAMSAALESYKADNGTYPGNTDTNSLNPTTDFNSSPPTSGTNKYSKASLYLYEQLAGVTSGLRSETPSSRSYYTFTPNMLSPKDTNNDIVGISDPFGNLYGYCTSKNPMLNPSGYTTAAGNNPTFDLWSTSGGITPSDISKWTKNW